MIAIHQNRATPFTWCMELTRWPRHSIDAVCAVVSLHAWDIHLSPNCMRQAWPLGVGDRASVEIAGQAAVA